MKLSNLIEPEAIVVPTRATEKFSVIRELVEQLDKLGKFQDNQTVLNAVNAREELRSTGIGSGLAIPHAKCQACPSLAISLGKPPTPIDFQSNDGQPCELIVLLVSSPRETSEHIQVLARISRLWFIEPFRQAVRDASDAAALYEALKQYE